MKIAFGLKMAFYTLAFVLLMWALLTWLFPMISAMMLFGTGADLRIVKGDYTGYDSADDLMMLQVEAGRNLPDGLAGIQFTFIDESGGETSFISNELISSQTTKTFRFDVSSCGSNIVGAYVSPAFGEGVGGGSRAVEFKSVGLSIDSLDNFYDTACSTCVSGGEGTSKNPVTICSCDELQKIDEGLGLHYILGKSISCQGYDFKPIGSNGFRGTLDGQGNVVWGLSIIGENNVGMFALTRGATISNIKIVNGGFAGQLSVGSLIGKQEGGIVTNAYSDSYVRGVADVGGLIGYSMGDVQDSYSKGEVEASIIGGELVGTCECMIKNSTSAVVIDAPYSGFIGKIVSGGVLRK